MQQVETIQGFKPHHGIKQDGFYSFGKKNQNFRFIDLWVAKKPCLFHRLMMRICFGLHWNDDKQPK